MFTPSFQLTEIILATVEKRGSLFCSPIRSLALDIPALLWYAIFQQDLELLSY